MDSSPIPGLPSAGLEPFIYRHMVPGREMVSEAVQVIQDLAVVLIAAALMAALFERLHQRPLVGYIIAGIILGPYTPPFSLLTHPGILNLFAQIGIVFLLMILGMEFPVARLQSVGRPALVIALIESLATFVAGYLVGVAFHLSQFDSLFLGLAVSVTSTVILANVLEEMGVIRGGTAGLVLGLTVIEDVIAVSLLGILQSVAATGGLSLVQVGVSLALVVALIVATLVLGSRAVPPLIDTVAKGGKREQLLLTILALGLGLSVLSSLIGISVATGAFLAGVLVAESRAQASAREMVTPIKELFGAIFFVSMGALMDFSLLPPYLLLIAALLAVSLGVKFLATYAAARSQGIPPRQAEQTALAIAGPRGELSLVVAQGGGEVQATSLVVLPTVGAITILTSILAPFLMRLAWKTEKVPGDGTATLAGK